MAREYDYQIYKGAQTHVIGVVGFFNRSIHISESDWLSSLLVSSLLLKTLHIKRSAAGGAFRVTAQTKGVS
jgi:hypothetical protein